eukprot:scaffold65762_cov60-Phaeocystis_antarctica.AAC.2
MHPQSVRSGSAWPSAASGTALSRCAAPCRLRPRWRSWSSSAARLRCITALPSAICSSEAAPRIHRPGPRLLCTSKQRGSACTSAAKYGRASSALRPSHSSPRTKVAYRSRLKSETSTVTRKTSRAAHACATSAATRRRRCVAGRSGSSQSSARRSSQSRGSTRQTARKRHAKK